MTTIETGTFADVCAMARIGDDRYASVISPIWTIGPKVHGGTLVAATAAAGLRGLRDDGRADPEMFPVAVTTDFLGAPDPGEVHHQVVVRKVGRQICLVDVELSQGDRLCARSSITLSQLDEAPDGYQAPLPDMPAEPPVDALSYADETDPAAALMAKIVHLAQGCDLRIDNETVAFLRGDTAEPAFRLWARPRESDAADPDVTALFALMTGDISPPVTYNLGHFGWAPTVHLTTYLRRRPAPGWLRVLSHAHTLGGRFFDEDQLVLDSTGATIVQSRQLAMLPKG